ncbi:hypothetical protein LRD18_11925 [Halorhodospira halochloris]|nr:hypothetical protein [Halorhodospira halochloris]
MSFPSDPDEADQADLDALEDALDNLDREPPEGYKPPPEGDWDAVLPVGDGEVEFEAEAGDSSFFFDVVEAQGASDSTQVDFLDFDEDYELVFNLPGAYDGDAQTLDELHEADLGDDQFVEIRPIEAFEGEGDLERVEIYTSWGTDSTSEDPAEQGTITLQLQGVTDPEQIGVEVI